MTADDDTVLTAPSGATYRLPAGEEVARIDQYLARMRLTHTNLPADVDALLDARTLLTSQTGDTP